MNILAAMRTQACYGHPGATEVKAPPHDNYLKVSMNLWQPWRPAGLCQVQGFGYLLSPSPPWGPLRGAFPETVVAEVLLVLHVCASRVCLRPLARQAPPGEACRHVAHELAGPRVWEARPKVCL